MALDFLKIPDDNAVRVPAEPLRQQVAAIFEAVGTPTRYAQITADALTLASLEGSRHPRRDERCSLYRVDTRRHLQVASRNRSHLRVRYDGAVELRLGIRTSRRAYRHGDGDG